MSSEKNASWLKPLAAAPVRDVNVGDRVRVSWSNGAGYTTYEIHDPTGSAREHVFRHVGDHEYGGEAPATTEITWTPLRYPGGDPENGPARANPVNGCTHCGAKDADTYYPSGLCSVCGDIRMPFRGQVVHVIDIIIVEDLSVGIAWHVEDFNLVSADGKTLPTVENMTDDELDVLNVAVRTALEADRASEPEYDENDQPITEGR